MLSRSALEETDKERIKRVLGEASALSAVFRIHSLPARLVMRLIHNQCPVASNGTRTPSILAVSNFTFF